MFLKMKSHNKTARQCSAGVDGENLTLLCSRVSAVYFFRSSPSKHSSPFQCSYHARLTLELWYLLVILKRTARYVHSSRQARPSSRLIKVTKVPPLENKCTGRNPFLGENNYFHFVRNVLQKVKRDGYNNTLGQNK